MLAVMMEILAPLIAAWEEYVLILLSLAMNPMDAILKHAMLTQVRHAVFTSGLLNEISSEISFSNADVKTV